MIFEAIMLSRQLILRHFSPCGTLSTSWTSAQMLLGGGNSYMHGG